jgi:y4mF family transcriptional regulator
MDIGLKVKELRKKAHLTQVECAKRVGVGLRFMRELEQGKTTLRLDKIIQVLEFFGYHIEVERNDKAL